MKRLLESAQEWVDTDKIVAMSTLSDPWRYQIWFGHNMELRCEATEYGSDLSQAEQLSLLNVEYHELLDSWTGEK